MPQIKIDELRDIFGRHEVIRAKIVKYDTNPDYWDGAEHMLWHFSGRTINLFLLDPLSSEVRKGFVFRVKGTAWLLKLQDIEAIENVWILKLNKLINLKELS
jgi:hypothetical protein